MGSWQEGLKDPADDLKLRVIAIFVLLVTSAIGSILPILSSRSYPAHGEKPASRFAAFAPVFFDFTKYLGSGIIIATAFVHLLSPAFEELNDPSLPEAWLKYDWAAVLAMGAVFLIFTVELLAFRIGTQVLDKMGVAYDAHENAHSSHGPCESTTGHDEEHHFLDGDTSGDQRTYTIMEEDGEHDVSAPLLSKRPSTFSNTRPRSMQRQFSSQRHMLYGTMDEHSKSCCLHDPKKRRSIAAKMADAASPRLDGNLTGNGGTAPLTDTNLHHHHHEANRVGHDEHGHHHHGHHNQAHHSAHQIIGVAILEFGVVLHSFVVGMTLAVVERFPTLFVVITLHQMFEGLGLGARLAGLNLPKRLHWVPVAAALLFSAITPIGLAIGLGFRKTYSPSSPTALIVSGILDSLSAGVLLYTGLVELLCAEFLFHQEMKEAPLGRVLYALGCVILGAIAMSILGIWA